MHNLYAESLSEFGSVVELSQCRAWIIRRQVPDTQFYDAMGCYPIFSCGKWSKLYNDLESIKKGIVCLSMVTDPFGDYEVDYLRKCFPDVVIPFKKHFVIDLSERPESFVSSHHLRNARKALDNLEIEFCREPAQFLNDWNGLYSVLIQRHGIKGITAFSKSSFKKQLSVPGLYLFRALHEGSTAGMILWYVQGQVGYYHLGAYSDTGYDHKASFALFRHCIGFFADLGLEWLSLGAGAGVANDQKDGLTRFKQGWSTGERTAWFCGRIYDKQEYSKLVKLKNVRGSDYFPAYRKGEFEQD
ncbi:GNAT family N-acetyltransferase [Fibrobacterota bacterium]